MLVRSVNRVTTASVRIEVLRMTIEWSVFATVPQVRDLGNGSENARAMSTRYFAALQGD